MIEVLSKWITIIGFFHGVLTGRYSEALAFGTFLRNVAENLLRFGKVGETTCALPRPAYTLITKIEIIPKTTTRLEHIDLFPPTISFSAVFGLRFLHRLPLHVGRNISTAAFERDDMVHDVNLSDRGDSLSAS
ncbi:MAG TPA: hypothetical protein VFG11_03180 [Acidobacteriota bacterium]|nr:hypothetical protein [Acidobacteriota bacterium]